MPNPVEKNSQTIIILLTLISGLVGLTAYSFTTFETKEVSRDDKKYFDKRLDRIEGKVDDLIKNMIIKKRE